jgi:hypothetical protein
MPIIDRNVNYSLVYGNNKMVAPVAQFKDTSGKITVGVFTHTSSSPSGKFNRDVLEIPDEWVCIGGGGTGWENPARFLAASFPSEKNGWVISCVDRDLSSSGPINLTVYALGLQIAGMSKEDLKGNIKYEGDTEETSGISISIDPKFSLLGGGFQTAWEEDPLTAGKIVTASFPDSSFSWKLQSTDLDNQHREAITGCAIGIKTDLRMGNTTIGRIVSTFNRFRAKDSVQVEPLEGFAMCGGGAECPLSDCIWDLSPSLDSNKPLFFAKSKKVENDHLQMTFGYAMGIQLLPP